MGKQSGIAWTRSTFNPWIGCTEVSPACDNCYARELDHRWGKDRWGDDKPRTRTSVNYWKQPYQWNAAAETAGEFWPVFCASLADICEDRRDLDSIREELKSLVSKTRSLTWLFLTKRPELYLQLFGWDFFESNPHVWAGTTVESNDYLDRVTELVKVPTTVHWLSVEPQLGFVTLTGLPRVEWIISGGESGPHARPFNLEWARDLHEQAMDTHAAFFLKQLGSNPVDGPWSQPISLRHNHGADPAEWPEDLRVQQFPVWY